MIFPKVDVCPLHICHHTPTGVSLSSIILNVTATLFGSVARGICDLTLYGSITPKVLILRHLSRRERPEKGVYATVRFHTPWTPVPTLPNGQNLGATWAQNQASFALFSPVRAYKGN